MDYDYDYSTDGDEQEEDRVRGVVNECPLETPALLQAALQNMEAVLQNLPLQHKRSYSKAMLSGNNVYIASLRLVFLRKTLFRAEQAALQYCQWLDLLEQHFGAVALQRPLLLQDLDKDSIKLLRSGCFQLLPSRDKVGRRICMFLEEAYGGGNHKTNKGYSVETRIKVSLFVMITMAEDVQTQQQGFVMITKKARHAGRSNYCFWNQEHSHEYERFVQCMPLRCTADHVWTTTNAIIVNETSDAEQDGVVVHNVARGLVPTNATPSNSLRIHSTTTDTSWMNDYGISSKDIPLTASGTLKTNNWNQIVKYWRAQEHYSRRISPVQPGMECPTFQDVVFRHVGGPSSVNMDHHPPNKVFHSILKSILEPYRCNDDALVASQMPAIVSSAIQQARNMRYRFYSWDHKQCWYVSVDGDEKVYSLQSLVQHAVKEQVRAMQRTKKRPQSMAEAAAVQARSDFAMKFSPVGVVSRQQQGKAQSNRHDAFRNIVAEVSARYKNVCANDGNITSKSNNNGNGDDPSSLSTDWSIEDTRRQHKRPRRSSPSSDPGAKKKAAVASLDKQQHSQHAVMGSSQLVALNMALQMQVIERSDHKKDHEYNPNSNAKVVEDDGDEAASQRQSKL